MTLEGVTMECMGHYECESLEDQLGEYGDWDGYSPDCVDNIVTCPHCGTKYNVVWKDAASGDMIVPALGSVIKP